MPVISILTAFYNEEPNLAELRRRLVALADGLRGRYDFEFVLIDDCSSDGGPELARAWAAEDDRVHYLRLARNGGSHAAYAAGLTAARGDCGVLIAADLQDPPESILELLDQWQAGHEVVWATRALREGVPWHTQFAARLYYAAMRRWALPQMPARGADLVLLDRKVIDVLNAVPEKHTSLLGMVLWLGFRQTTIDYVKCARHAGRSKWTLRRKFKLFADSILSFSTMPVHLVWWAAAAAGAAFGCTAVAAGWRAGVENMPVPGWMWVLLAVLGVGWVQLGALGIALEYLWRAFDQVRGRPRYVVAEERHGTEAETIRPARRAG
jgi:dolichol-phosphate mannosyltransferase